MRQAERSSSVEVRTVEGDEWKVVAWLWQAFRSDLAPIVHGLPYASGRYATGPLDGFPSEDGVGTIAWRPHPRTGELAPVGFALVEGLRGPVRSVAGFWIAPAARRDGIGTLLALEALRHDGPWEIGFQHDNVAAGAFWRGIAERAFGSGGWAEVRRAAPAHAAAPADHIIVTR